MALAAAVTMSSVPVVAFAEEGGDTTPTPASAPADNTPAPADNTPADKTEDNISDVKPNEKPVVKDGPIEVTVVIPSTPDDDPATEDKENQNTEPFGTPVGTATGDTPNGPDDNNYDYEVTTQQGSVTVETTENSGAVTEYGQDNMDYVASETAPAEDNDLIKENICAAPDEYLPGNQQGSPLDTEAPADGADEEYYQYEYVGTGNTTQFRPGMVFTEPMTDEEKVQEFGDHYQNGAYIWDGYYTKNFVGWLDEAYRSTIAKTEDGKYVTDEQGFILDKDGNRVLKVEQTMVGPDGKTYYLHRFDANGKGNYVEGWYNDADWVEVDGEKVFVEGKWETELNGGKSHSAVWTDISQFVLVDKATGEVITTYCADINTGTQDNFGYHIVNLEDSTYYDDAQAEQIRAIAKNGYWGTKEGTGSLDAMKENMLASGQFTPDELDALTDGVALTATQMAIWSCSNNMSGVEFVNTHYFETPDMTETDGYGVGGNIPADKEEEAKLVMKLYDYLKNLTPVSYEGKETTADTIINADNFLKGDMEITVLEKAEDHTNNQDDRDDNDAYKANLSFALVVQPSTENGDDLVVSVVNGHGDVVAKGRVAGDASEDDDTFTGITDHGNGNYSFDNITMIEGDQAFNITMEGIQNLKEGVYLFSSEVEVDEATEDTTSSQTMVGMAKGDHEVKVSQNISFSFDVEDEKVVVRKKHSGSKKDKDKEKDKEKEKQVEIFEEDVPLADFPGYEIGEPVVEDVEIGEEEVPMAEIPLVAGEEVSVIAQTGDSNHMAGAFGGMFAALAGMFFLRRKKED